MASGSLRMCPVSTATSRSSRRITPFRTSWRAPATLAALAGSHPTPDASTTALASRISASLTAVTTPFVSRIADADRARHGVGLDLVPPGEPLGEATRERRRALRLNSGEPRQLPDQPPLMGLP